MRSTLVLLAGVALLGLWGCGGGDGGAPAVPLSAGSPAGEGIVTAITGSVVPKEGLTEGQGSLRFDVSHTDRLVNKSVDIEIKDAAGTVVATVQGNEQMDLAAGSYSAAVSYDENERLNGYKGSVTGLVVHAGHETGYKIGVEAPFGLLRMRFSDGEESLSEKTTLTVYRANDNPELVVGPAWSGPATELVMLAADSYQVKAVYQPDSGGAITEWHRPIEVRGALARTEKDIVMELDITGLRVDAFNFGRDVNRKSRVYLYAEGADIEFAVAKFQGKAGEAIPADPGSYDVRVVYTPSDSALNFVGDKTLRGVKVSAGLGSRIQADVELPLATLRLKVLDGDIDVSDKAEIRVMRTGADKDAASPLVDELGVGSHPVPIGKADITIRAVNKEGSTPRSETFRAVELLNGWSWEQTFALGDTTWEAEEALKPTEPPRPITWVVEGDDDDSAGDDDDSAGDDDDSAAAKAAPGPK